jgi:hypothetical protein
MWSDIDEFPTFAYRFWQYGGPGQGDFHHLSFFGTGKAIERRGPTRRASH